MTDISRRKKKQKQSKFETKNVCLILRLKEFVIQKLKLTMLSTSYCGLF